MKKFIYTALAAALCAGVSQARALKMNATSRQIADMYISASLEPNASYVEIPYLPATISPMSKTAQETGCIITLADGVTPANIEAQGFTVDAVIDNIITARGTVSNIISLASSDLVSEVNFDQLNSPCTDWARKSIGIDDVHNGTNLSQKYDGEGVICGIYDTGVDPNHVNFYDRAFTKNRVERVWRYSGSGGTPFSYTTPDAIAKFTTDNTGATHGTHTLGCMAGGHNTAGSSTGTTKPKGSYAYLNSTNGSTSSAAKKNIYYGMAPGASIAVGCGPLYDTNITNALNNIVTYAESEGRPAVINLSIGHLRGPHDGTDQTSRTLATLGKRAIIFMAAGNDGDVNLSISKTFSAGETEYKTFMDASSSFSGIIEFWSADDRQFTVTPVVYDLTANKVLYELDHTGTGTTVLATSNYTVSSYKHDSNFDAAFSSSSVSMTGADNATTNNRFSVSAQVVIGYNATTNSDRHLILGFKVKGATGQRVDMIYNASSGNASLSSKNIAGYTDGTPDMSISGMACGENIIVVGSYNTREYWPSFKGTYSYSDPTGLIGNQISGFSSYGVLADGRSLPDVCAPGAAIISSISSYYTNNTENPDGSSACYKWNNRWYSWEAQQGTSMATPIAAGVAAVMLQANPKLDVNAVKTIFKTTSKMDYYDPNISWDKPERWGAGRIQAYDAVKEAIKMSGVSDIVSDKSDIMLQQNGNSFRAFVTGATSVDMKLYSLSGNLVAAATSGGDSAELSAEAVTPGLYILNINGTDSRRVVIR